MTSPAGTRFLTLAALLLLVGSEAAVAAPAFNYLASPVDVTPTVAGAWRDVDVSAYVPPGATGVLVLCHNPSAFDRPYGIRMNGSTDTWQTQVEADEVDQSWLMTGLDANRVFEVYTGSTAVRTYLLGYTMEGVTFFTNRVQKTIGFLNSWRNVDISADTGTDTAVGAIFTVVNTSTVNQHQFGLRKNGSTDDRVRELESQAATLGLVGVDASELAEFQVDDTAIDLYLVGYVTYGAVFFTNGINKSTFNTGTYQDVDITSNITSRANGAFVEIYNFGGSKHRVGLRRNGSASDLYLDHMHGFAAVGIDANDIFEQKVENTAMDLYLMGYSLDPKTSYRSIGTAFDYTTGSVSATNGSTIVTGAGTAWQSANRGRGDRIQIDVTNYTILSVNSETQLTLESPFLGVTGSSKPHRISRQYSTLPAWEDCVDGGPCSYFSVASPSLVADDRFEVGVVYKDTPLTAGVAIDGATTDGARRITLTADGGNRHTGVAGSGALVRPVSASPAVSVRDDFVTVEWLELSGASGGTTGVAVSGIGTSNQIVVRNNVIHDMTLHGLENSSATTRLDFYNNILYAMGGSGVRLTQSLVKGRLFNNTAFNCGSYGFQGNAGTGTVLKNNLAHSSLPNDFSMSPISPASSNNLAGDGTGIPHSPAGFGLNLVSLASLQFVSTTSGTEDLHIQSGSAAQGRGETLTWLFLDDIDGAVRETPWEAGADEVGSLGGVPSMSSAANQVFMVGSSPQPAAVITISDDPVDGTITASDDVRLRIPAGFSMRWDETVASVVLGGSASIRVDVDVLAYEDFGKTLVLDVLMDFLPGDILTVSGIRFLNFTAPSPPDYLELEVENDGVASAFDTRSIEVRANGTVTLTSERDQLFSVGAPPHLAETIYVTDGAPTPFISPTADIRIAIPAALAMEWDSSVSSVSLSGSAAAKVSPNPVYESPTTVRFDVTASFLAGEFVSISGLQFWNFAAVSPPSSLTLDAGGSADTDDKLIRIYIVSDVPVLTATATDSQVVVEWVNPSIGDCAFVHLRARDDGSPPSISDRILADLACVVGAKYSIPDTGLVNGNLYHYAVFVEDSTSSLTPGNFVTARPFANLGTTQWAYSTGATSLAPPGLRLSAPESFVYAVSNDAILHSMTGGWWGGTWPAAWFPYRLGAPAQARPPVVGFPVGSPAIHPAAFLGSQDGSVYAIDAVTGAPTWVAPIGPMVQAAPAGHFSPYFAGAHDVVMTGTRDSSGPNRIEALQLHSGLPAWTYDNSATYGGDGTDVGIVSSSISVDYPNARAYFASRQGTGGNASPDTLWCIRFTAAAPTHQWSIDVGNIDGAPVLFGGVLYVGTNAGILYAIDAGTGIVNWSRDLNDGAIKGYAFPHFGTTNVFVATSNKVWSIADGGGSSSVNWSVPSSTIPGPSTPTYIAGTGKLLVGSSNGNLYQIDVLSPLTPASVTLGSGGSVIGSPTYDVVTGTIYAGSDEGVIYAVRFPIP